MAAACLLALGAVYGQRRRTRRMLETMNRMLDAAMQVDFTEDSFDETLLSALESKLAHYLAASTTSARQVAAEKEKLKSLIGDISHQTKTPMANILLYTQLLMEQPGNAACLHALDAQTRKLNSLIDALVKTSRLESGVIALQPVPGRLHALLESAAAQVMPKAIDKGISITVEDADAGAVFDPKVDAGGRLQPGGQRGQVHRPRRQGRPLRRGVSDVFGPACPRQRDGHCRGGAVPNLPAVLPRDGASRGGGRGHRAVSGAQHCRGAGRLCEGRLARGQGQHLLPVPAQKVEIFQN